MHVKFPKRISAYKHIHGVLTHFGNWLKSLNACQNRLQTVTILKEYVKKFLSF